MLVAIQADDLTGACDTGAPFADRGLATVVLLPEGGPPAAGTDVLVLDTESRGLAPGEARARAREAGERLAAMGPGHVYKKLDSTLRGPVAAEVAGMLEGTGRVRAVIAPAFPAQGRTILDGGLRLDGRPAEETPFARDPHFPPTGGSLLAPFARSGPHPVSPIPLATIRRGPAAVGERLARWPGAFVADAESDADLRVLLAGAIGLRPLLVGSAGLAAALAARLGGAGTTPPRPRGPLLVIAGSPHPATVAQVEALEAQGLKGCWIGGDEASEELAAVLAGLPASAFLAVRAGEAPLDPPGRARVVKLLAETTRRLLADAPGRDRERTLLLAGGETACAVLRVLGARGVRLLGSLTPGLAIGQLFGGEAEGFTVLTKAGGFGDPGLLRRVLEELG